MLFRSATSGTYELELTLTELLTQSYDLLQVGQDGETLTGDMFTRGRNALNIMLKTWEAQGIHLWTMTEGVLFLQVGQSIYPFSDTTTHVSNTYYETTATSAYAAGVNVIAVASTDGMVEGNHIGIVGSDNDLQWSTIAAFISDTSVRLSSAITTATLDNAVIYHYAPSFKPVNRVLSVRRKEGSSYEVPINFISRDEYMSLPNKDTQGYPIQAYYSREENRGTMYVWNAPSSSVPVMPFTYERKIEIMVNAEDTFDMPEYWYEAIAWNLAARMMPKVGCSAARAQEIKSMAISTLNTCLGFDTDLYPIKVVMNQR